MALLKNLTTNQIVQLQHKHLFGSAQQWIDTLLIFENSAPIQAAIYFDQGVWYLENLATNSHCIIINNDQCHIVSEQAILALGTVINFSPNNQESKQASGQTWRVINIDPPKYFLHAMHTNDLYIELMNTIHLPKSSQHNCKLIKTTNNQWQYQKDNLRFELQEGSILAFKDEIWRFSATLPAGFNNKTNIPVPTSQQPFFWFYVSKDEEHVQIIIDYNSQRFDLGERVHHYLLLLLARKRQADVSSNYDLHTQGWIDIEEIITQLKLEPNVLNMQITRLRRHFASYLNKIPPLEKGIIERRPRQLRFTFTAFKIYRGSMLEK